MTSSKLETYLAVVEYKNFTQAAEALALTQPAVSHHISQLEEEFGVQLLIRGRGGIKLTYEGELVAQYARRMKAQYDKLLLELSNSERKITQLRVGITHTAESSIVAETLASYRSKNNNLNITLYTDTIKNLYEKLENYELDLAIGERTPHSPELNSIMLDTDYLVCVMSNNNPLAAGNMVTTAQLKHEQLILRLPSSATRELFESSLLSIGDTIMNYNVTLEVDNIATIKDLIRKDLGVSILPKSACMDELSKGKITVLPIENLSMLRETKIIYSSDFNNTEILHEIIQTYQRTAAKYRV